ncbi:MAG: carboxypeptidase-like regulatory domain-containing protein, partial [Opitutaceae bacterium]
MNDHRSFTSFAAFAQCLRAIAWLTGLALGPIAFSQGVVSSGLTGLVRDEAGKPVPGATLTATHLPTGTSYWAAS